MSEPDIKRQTEVFLCQKLQLAIPEHVFLPMSGGDSTNDAFEIEPPFTVVSVRDAEKRYDQQGTWFLQGTCQIITHSGEVPSPEHAQLSRRVYAILDGILPQATAEFSFHGISIDRTRSAVDDESQARADIYEFSVGAGG